MEKDCGSWFHSQHSEQQSPYLNYLSASLEVGWENSLAAYMNPYCNELSINGTFPGFAYSGMPLPKACQLNEPGNWFPSLPPYPQAFAPGVNSLPKEKLSSEPTEKCGRTGGPNADPDCTQKKFLVFDQSGDQTTLIFSSGLGSPVQCLTSWNPKAPAVNDPVKEDFRAKRCTFPHFEPFAINEYNEDNQRDETESQMHEDTEELNALLYSDDDESESSEDEEVTSTGHSPSTMTEHGIQEWFEEGEEVASSASPTKKRKLSSGDFDVVGSPVNVPSSEKPSELEDDDAESSCGGNFDDRVSEETNPLSVSGKKRSRKEKIRQTVSILQSIIPGGKGKDAMVVIDEAIHYLKSLKVKAKSLGLDAL